MKSSRFHESIPFKAANLAPESEGWRNLSAQIGASTRTIAASPAFFSRTGDSLRGERNSALWLDLDPRDGVDRLLLSRHGVFQITVGIGPFDRVWSDI